MTTSDCIERNAAKNAMCRFCSDVNDWRLCPKKDVCNIICRFDSIPTADVVSGREFRDCRNELCLKCGEYTRRHLGACDGCRWRDA